VAGVASCTFDCSGPTAGHYVKISSNTAGDCADAGASYPSGSGQVIGRVLATVTGGANANVLLFSPSR
jgi:hypothetical protein